MALLICQIFTRARGARKKKRYDPSISRVYFQGASCTIRASMAARAASAAKGPRQDTPRLRQVAQINMRRRVMTIVPGVPFLNIRRSRYRELYYCNR
jgi:hypothetical protein